ncbi:hypothetical protein BGZ83_003901 [Gryganskiella cystojenkinii]|nr:hypothetical protein BGZ83_003901 [Gryganskiella cystojenkinii]
MTDQRRHTVDFSNWSSMGLTFEHFAPLSQQQQQQQQSQQNQRFPTSSTEDPAGPTDPRTYGPSPSSTSSSIWDRNHSKTENLQCQGSLSPLHFSSGSKGAEGQNKTTILHSYRQQQQHQGNVHLHPLVGSTEFPSGNNNTGVTNINDFGRRASMSQLSFYSGKGGGDNGPWDQPNALYETVSLSVPMSTQPQSSWDHPVSATPAAVDFGRDSFLTIRDEASYGSSDSTEQMNTVDFQLGQQRPSTSSQQQQAQHYYTMHQAPSSASGRRNSRILPNPIQPPTYLKFGTEESQIQGNVDYSIGPHDLPPTMSSHKPMNFHHNLQSQQQGPFCGSASTSTTSFSDMGRSEEDDYTTTTTSSSSMSSISTMPSNGTSVQHGGFVPGLDTWSRSQLGMTTENQKKMTFSSSHSNLDLLGQRRNSESVLQGLVSSADVDYLSMASMYRTSTTAAANAAATAASPISSGHSSRSSSPLDGQGGCNLNTLGSNNFQHQPGISVSYFRDSRGSGGGQDMRRDHSLSSLEEELAYAPASHDDFETPPGSRVTGPGHNRPLSSLHPHFATGQVVETKQDTCGLCSMQPATVPLGICGHRICDVCHRHEKHRSLRLFQNATPPCPFCAHGITQVDKNNASSPSSNAGVHPSHPHRLVAGMIDSSLKQQRHLSLPPPARHQPQPQRPLSSSSLSTLTQNRRVSVAEISSSGQQEFGGDAVYGVAATTPASAPMLWRSSTSMQSDISSAINQSTGSNSPYQQRVTTGYLQQQPQQPQQQQQRRSSLNQFAPVFQPHSTMTALTTQDRDNSTSEAINPLTMLCHPPGITSLPSGQWRDTRTLGVAHASITLPTVSSSSSSASPADYHQEMMYNPDMTTAVYSATRRTSIQYQVSQSTNPTTAYYSGLNQISSPNTLAATALSFPIMPDLPPFTPPTIPRTEAIQWAVIRVTNIPWDVSLQDMQGFLAGFPFPPEHLLSQNVHILMDRATGKTFNSAFVELALENHHAGRVAQARNLKVLKGRLVTVELSSQDELMRSIFPKWAGEFNQGEPLISGETSSTLSEGNATEGTAVIAPSASTPPFVTREEINALLVVCRNYKLHFSRKCAERPFENILSILTKYPWHQPHRVPPLHRDHIFELLKLSIESLRLHLNKEYNTIHPTLLMRMVRCAILTPAFTERQKSMVLHVAGLTSCPEDLVSWMSPIVVVVQVQQASATTELSTPPTTENTMDIVNGGGQGTELSNTDLPNDLITKGTDQENGSALEDEIEALAIKDTFSSIDSQVDFPALSSSTESSPVLGTAAAQGTAVSWAAVVAPTSAVATPALTPLVAQTDVLIAVPARSASSTSPTYASAVVQPSLPSPTATPISKTVSAGASSPTAPKTLKAAGSPGAQRPGIASLLSSNASGSWKPMAHSQHTRHHHQQHHTGRSLSLSSFASFTSTSPSAASSTLAVTPRLPLGAIAYSFPSLTSSLQKRDKRTAARTDQELMAAKVSLSASSPTLKSLEGPALMTTAATTSNGRLTFRQRSGSLPRLALPLMILKTSTSSALPEVPSSPATTTATTTAATTPSYDAWSRSSSLSSSSSSSPSCTGGTGLVGSTGLGGSITGASMATSTTFTSPKPTTATSLSIDARSTSESILDAIKTITQSTPRLTKPLLSSSGSK